MLNKECEFLDILIKLEFLRIFYFKYLCHCLNYIYKRLQVVFCFLEGFVEVILNFSTYLKLAKIPE